MFTAAAVREDSGSTPPTTARRGTRFELLDGRREKTTEDAEDTEKPVKSDVKKVENNKSAFYYKIKGFLFGSLKNNHYLCKQKETTLLIIKNRAATYKRH